MNTTFRHCHHRVDGSHEGWAVVFFEKLCCRHNQVTTSRKSHGANLGRIDAVIVGMLLEISDSLTQIVLRIGISVASEYQPVVGSEGWHGGCAVVEHEG